MLRLYRWNPPALSLGRGQEAAGSHDPVFLEAEGIRLVRRPTGGGAVLHQHEVTYAVIGRLRHDPFPGGVVDTYRRVAQALAAALRALGVAADPPRPVPRPPRPAPASCFDATSAHEISVAGRKLAGSAQLRRRGAFLQHGSILLRADPDRLARALGGRVHAQGFTSLEQVMGSVPGHDAVEAAVVVGFERTFGAELVEGTPTAREMEEAGRLVRVRSDPTPRPLGGAGSHPRARPG